MQHIIKYSNRKLYNKNSSGYIGLEDIKDYVLNGVPFNVIDRETKLDITQEVLARTVSDLVINAGKISTNNLLALIITSFSVENTKEVVDTEQQSNYTNNVQ